jgi:hypothetical protein
MRRYGSVFLTENSLLNIKCDTTILLFNRRRIECVATTTNLL